MRHRVTFALVLSLFLSIRLVAQTGSTTHGPTNPALYERIVGTWQDNRCGTTINSFRISQSGSVLSVQLTAHPIRGDIRTCRISLGEQTQVSLLDPGFDGKVFWFFIPENGGRRELRRLVTDKSMVFESERASANAVQYVKAE